MATAVCVNGYILFIRVPNSVALEIPIRFKIFGGENGEKQGVARTLNLAIACNGWVCLLWVLELVRDAQTIACASLHILQHTPLAHLSL